MTKQHKIFRKPKNGEWIEYPCGCIYEIRVSKKNGFEIWENVFCPEHDPTLTKWAKDNHDDIDWSEV